MMLRNTYTSEQLMGVMNESVIIFTVFWAMIMVWLIVNQKRTGHYNKYDKIIVSKMVYKLSIMLINTFKYLNNLIILKKYYIIIKNIIYL